MDESNRIIGITAGVFDLVHTGHLLAFEYMKRYCDYLKVAIQVDPSQYREGKSQPIETIYERYVRLKSCSYINEILPYESEEDLCNILKTDIYGLRFIGADYYGHSFTGDSIRTDTFHFNPRDHLFSSTNLKQRVLSGRNISKRPKTAILESTPEYMTDIKATSEENYKKHEDFLREQQKKELEKYSTLSLDKPDKIKYSNKKRSQELLR